MRRPLLAPSLVASVALAGCLLDGEAIDGDPSPARADDAPTERLVTCERRLLDGPVEPERSRIRHRVETQAHLSQEMLLASAPLVVVPLDPDRTTRVSLRGRGSLVLFARCDDCPFEPLLAGETRQAPLGGCSVVYESAGFARHESIVLDPVAGEISLVQPAPGPDEASEIVRLTWEPGLDELAVFPMPDATGQGEFFRELLVEIEWSAPEPQDPGDDDHDPGDRDAD